MIIASVAAITLVVSFWLFGDNSEGAGYFTGLLERLNVWNELTDQVAWTEMLFPYRQFTYGTGAMGVVGFWDNTYFYFLFTQGIVGTVLWFVLLRKEYTKGMTLKHKELRLIVYYMTITFLVLSLTVNVTQGRGFFSLYLLLLGIITNCKCSSRKLK